jgi:hypothetical protein
MPVSLPPARKWHKDSVFGDGPRVPMCRERRAVWKARLDMLERAGRITPAFEKIGRALLRRLGGSGQCDPSHETLAADTGKDPSTVKEALKRLRELGFVWWVRRLIRAGWRTEQTSNAYVLTLGLPQHCEAEIPRPTKKLRFCTASGLESALPDVPYEAQRAAQVAVEAVGARRQAERDAAYLAKRLNKGAVLSRR